jgi:hypothetical protein
MTETTDQKLDRLRGESEVAAARLREAVAALDAAGNGGDLDSDYDRAERQTQEALDGLRRLGDQIERRRRSPLRRLLGV